MSIEYLVICDKCAKVLAGSQKNARTARRGAARDLGALVAQPGGQDYCAECCEASNTDSERDK